MWGSDYVQERHIGKEAVLCLRKDSNCVFELVLFLLCSTSIDHQRMACFSAFRKFVFVGLGLDLLYCLLSGPYRYNISKPMQGRLFAKAYDRYKETGESIDQVLKEGAWKCSQRAAMLGSQTTLALRHAATIGYDHHDTVIHSKRICWSYYW